MFEIIDYETYNEEYESSIESYEDARLIKCPSLCSYSSLELLTSCSDEAQDEEDCRLVKLNNAIKKLADLIDDPRRRDDVPAVCCLLHKLLQYNGNQGFYLKHLPQIGEILEFLSMRSKEVQEYLDILTELLTLCSLAPLLQRSSESLHSTGKLQRHFSLLGYLMVIAPTRCHFLLAKNAIEHLVADEGSLKKRSRRRDAVKPDVCREAVEASRLPVTLAELARVASDETYPAILELILAVVSVSTMCCYRILEAGIENILLLRMHPAYEQESKCLPIDDDADLHIDEPHNHEAADLTAKILWRLMTTLIFTDTLPESMKCLQPPSEAAMWSLKAAFKRAVLLSKRSSHSRKLRNDLANLLLASLIRSRAAASWELGVNGIAEDLVDLSVASELGTVARDTWLGDSILEINARGHEALTFKKTLLLALALIAQVESDFNCKFKNKGLARGLLQLIDPRTESSRVPWNPAQLHHLLKYAANALAYLAPKVPEEFLSNNGSSRLFETLERLRKISFDGDDDGDADVTCLLEMTCSLSSANCDSILDDFGKHGFVPLLLKWADRILTSEALSLHHQKILTYLLITSENIIDNKKCLLDCHCDSIVKTVCDLLQRCLRLTNQDSELEQSFLSASGSFVWKCVTGCSRALDAFFKQAGLYSILDLMESANLATRNFYLAVVCDMCEASEFARCGCFLLSWRGRSDRNKGLLSLLANIWRDEQRILDVRRTAQGCLETIEFPLLNDEQWHYVYFTRSFRQTNNTAPSNYVCIGPARPKIYFLYKLIEKYAEKCHENYHESLIKELCTEDQLTLVEIGSYAELKKDEAMLSISRLLEHSSFPSCEPLLAADRKIAGWGSRVASLKASLLAEREAEETRAERDELRRIREACLAPGFHALEKLGFVARTSVGEYKRAKVEELRWMAEEEMMVGGKDRMIRRTFNARPNVTSIFNQQVTIRSIEKKSCEDKESKISSASSISSLTNISECSLASYKSESSFVLKNYKFDEFSGRVVA